MRKFRFTLIVIFAVGLSVNAQKLDSAISDYNYFNHSYKYLDRDFNIKIAPEKFQEFIIRYKFYPKMIRTCSDSLGVVLMGEFNDWTKARIAQQRILFSELRASYYLWTTEDKIRQLCDKYSYKYVYEFYEYFSSEEDKWDTDMKLFMAELRKKVIEHTGDESVSEMTNKKFLRFSLLHSPQRIKDSDAKRAKQANGDISCGKENCCQDKTKK
ncbi:hypothetical protein [Labilibaculum sp.]|uniref:hypothetical protein n=1 Tax=Labilibaculum sp. TaxID=2060723 RepID=UPI002AA76EDA|nr:hypothetical protein [Labilibaculum sp.]